MQIDEVALVVAGGNHCNAYHHTMNMKVVVSGGWRLVVGGWWLELVDRRTGETHNRSVNCLPSIPQKLCGPDWDISGQ